MTKFINGAKFGPMGKSPNIHHGEIVTMNPVRRQGFFESVFDVEHSLYFYPTFYQH